MRFVDPTGLLVKEALVQEAQAVGTELAMSDGPLPVLDVVAAGIILGSYIIAAVVTDAQLEEMQNKMAEQEEDSGPEVTPEGVILPEGWHYHPDDDGNPVYRDPEGYEYNSIVTDDQGNLIGPTLPPNYKYRGGNVINPAGAVEKSPLDAWNKYASTFKGENKAFWNRREAFIKAKDRAGIPWSQDAIDMWTVSGNIRFKGTDSKSQRYHPDSAHHGRFYLYETTKGRRVIVDHFDPDKGAHFHAGEPDPERGNPHNYDFRTDKYKPVGGDHHFFYIQ